MHRSETYAIINNAIKFIVMIIFILPLLAIYLLVCPYFWGNDDYGMIDHYNYLNGFNDFL